MKEYEAEGNVVLQTNNIIQEITNKDKNVHVIKSLLLAYLS